MAPPGRVSVVHPLQNPVWVDHPYTRPVGRLRRNVLRPGNGCQAGLCYLHVLAVMAAADPDGADDGAADRDREPAAEHDEAVDPSWRAHSEPPGRPLANPARHRAH